MSKTKIWTGAAKPDDLRPGPTNQEIYIDTFDQYNSIDKDILGLTEMQENNDIPNPANTNVTKGYEGWGLLVQEALYVDPELRKVLKFYKIGELQRLYPGCDMKEINTFRDALSLNAVKKASLTIKAERDGTVYRFF